MTEIIEYPLYLESGPRRKTTMVHVIDLLGCTCHDRTTEAALQAVPQAIQSFRAFLSQHGEQIDPNARFSTRVEQHVTEGPWIGYGDPAPGFVPDFLPLLPEDLRTYRRRLRFLHASLLNFTRDLSDSILEAEPERGRSIYHILLHVCEGETSYLRYQVGSVPPHRQILKGLRANPASIRTELFDLFQASENRLESLSAEEMTRFVPHGQVTWSIRRMFRRMLEHAWEHLMEIEDRLEVGGAA